MDDVKATESGKKVREDALVLAERGTIVPVLAAPSETTSLRHRTTLEC